MEILLLDNLQIQAKMGGLVLRMGDNLNKTRNSLLF